MKVWVVVALAVVAAIVKTLGGLLFGSRALLVDALTCIANLVALAGTTYYHRLSELPPDEDHHYGHYRLGFTGPIITLATYSFVAGVAVVSLLRFEEYEVSLYAPLMAAVGFALYLVVIFLSHRMGEFLSPYAFFTASELIESIVVIVSSLAGALLSYLIDYVGAVVLTVYIFYEVYETILRVSRTISDVAPPPELVEALRKELEREGFVVKRVRVRQVSKGMYHGDVVVAADPSSSVEEVHERLDRAERRLKQDYGFDVAIHVEPE